MEGACSAILKCRVGIQCHSSGASDSGHESGNFTGTPPYRELASQPDQHNIQKKGMESKFTLVHISLFGDRWTHFLGVELVDGLKNQYRAKMIKTVLQGCGHEL